MPGFTHLQPAQPVTFGHHLMAYVEMFGRDAGRFADAIERMNESPLGAAALAGTPFPIDRHMTAQALGFDRPTANSLDSVSARDFALEALSAASICATHLSRLAEEIVIWVDAAVRLRAADGRLHHRLLDHAAEAQPRRRRAGARQDRPHHWARCRPADRHEGPAAGLFQGHAGGQGPGCSRPSTPWNWRCKAMAGMIADLEPQHARSWPPPPAPASRPPRTWPTGWCATLNMPFREAHHVTGAAVKTAEGLGVDLADPALAQFRRSSRRSPPRSMPSSHRPPRRPAASATAATAPAQVRAQIARWKELLG
jgi:argininosuccinate lyase